MVKRDMYVPEWGFSIAQREKKRNVRVNGQHIFPLHTRHDQGGQRMKQTNVRNPTYIYCNNSNMKKARVEQHYNQVMGVG